MNWPEFRMFFCVTWSHSFFLISCMMTSRTSNQDQWPLPKTSDLHFRPITVGARSMLFCGSVRGCFYYWMWVIIPRPPARYWTSIPQCWRNGVLPLQVWVCRFSGWRIADSVRSTCLWNKHGPHERIFSEHSARNADEVCAYILAEHGHS